MSKKTQAFFRKQFEALLTEYGATKTESPEHYQWQVMTKAGLLLITVHDDDTDNLFGVYMKFNYPAKAVAHFKAHYLDIDNLNQFSGKYNHYHDDLPHLLDSINNRLKKLI